jgi:plastocyanin
VLALAACGESSSPASLTGGVTIGATITLTANGVSDAARRIPNGTAVRFTNNDSVTHQILSTPHGAHTECRGLNQIDTLAPGQSRDSAALSGSRGWN